MSAQLLGRLNSSITFNYLSFNINGFHLSLLQFHSFFTACLCHDQFTETKQVCKFLNGKFFLPALQNPDNPYQTRQHNFKTGFDLPYKIPPIHTKPALISKLVFTFLTKTHQYSLDQLKLKAK